VNARPRRHRLLAWLSFLVWALALGSAAAWLGRGPGGTWVPDAALVLAVLVLARSERGDLLPLSFCVALVRGAISGDAPLALLAGALGALLAVLALRSVVELSGPLGRALAAALAAGTLQAWLALAHAARAAEPVELGSTAGAALAVALSSAALALLLGPLLARLPGLTPLRSRVW
jgi:hypothetical protein